MPPTQEYSTPVPPSPASPGAFIKFVRIFLFVLIVIGIGLIATEHVWVPGLVTNIMQWQNPSFSLQSTQSDTQSVFVSITPPPWQETSQTKLHGWAESTYAIFSGYYKKNSYQVWYANNEIRGADPGSFTLAVPTTATDSEMDLAFSMDKSSVYYRGRKISTDRDSFMVIYDGWHDDACPFSVPYFKDRLGVYFATTSQPRIWPGVWTSQKIDAADSQTFSALGNGYAKDKDAVYYLGIRTQFNPDTFDVTKNGVQCGGMG